MPELSSPATFSGYIPVRDVAKSALAYAKSYPALKSSVETLEHFSTKAIALVPEPVSSRVVEYSTPLVNAADIQLKRGYEALPELKHAVSSKVADVSERVGAAAGAVSGKVSVAKAVVTDTVSSFVSTARSSSVSDVKPLLTTYYVQATTQFLSMAKTGNANKEEFVLAMKSRLSNVWSDNLVAPSELFFTKAHAVYTSSAQQLTSGERVENAAHLLQTIRNKLGGEWESKVIHTFVSLKQTTVANTEAVSGAVLSKWQKVLETSQSTFDKVLPAIESTSSSALEEKSSGVTLVSLTTHVSGRVRAHTAQQYQKVVALSSSALATATERIHTTKQQATTAAAPTIEAVSTRVEQTLAAVKQSLETLQTTLTQLKQSGISKAESTVTQVTSTAAGQAIQTKLTELQTLFHTAVEKAKELRANSTQYVIESRVSKLSVDFYHTVSATASATTATVLSNAQTQIVLTKVAEVQSKVQELIQYTKQQLVLEKAEKKQQAQEQKEKSAADL